PIVKEHDALVLDHHGALTIGKDIFDAYYKMETLEHYAQTMLVAHMLGGIKPLKSSQVEKLLDICGVYGLEKPQGFEFLTSPACSTPDRDAIN
ncbi:MAG: class II aldolase/adducin family protein, partial [Candidatus Obscuribacterales bacterium]|nr:class II aldolase/adducin family protein [Candidatus Obscuribacterales bacterium]